MLNDSISDVFQSLMLKEQPESNGLQDPVLAQNMFLLYTTTILLFKSSMIENYIGLLFQNIGVSLGRSGKFVSSGRISEKVKQQLGAIMHSSMPILKIHVVPVQQQSNGVGCDADAIAFTNCVLKEKRNPTEVTFKQETMRHNLLRSFATTTRTVRRCRTKTISLEVYCSCTMC